MKILIVQFRTDQSGWHEIKCVYEGLGVKYQDLAFVNVALEDNTADFLVDAAKNADKVIFGGLGESGFEETDSDKRAWVDGLVTKVTPMIEYLVEKDVPTLGVCFGHQLLGLILGSEIVQDKELAETGLVEINLTENGKKDPIFRGMGESFFAVEGHKSSVSKIPKGAVHLAYTDKCPVSGFKIKNNIYSFQFHAELSYQNLQERLELYPEYRKNTVDEDKTDDNVVLKAKDIIRNFAQL